MMTTVSITSISLLVSLLDAAAGAPAPNGPSPPSATAPTPPLAASPARAPSVPTLQPPSGETAAAPAGRGWPPGGGFALELGTGGLSGTIGGTLGLGWGWRKFQFGVAIDATHADLSSEQSGSDNFGHLRTTALAVGPWFRWTMGQTRDGRVDAIGAIDFQYKRMSLDTRNGDTGNGNSGAADGIVLRAGPGLRLWATPWLAVSYTAQVSLTDLSGPLVAFTGAAGASQGPLSYNFGDVEIALVGRLSVLAVF